MFLRSNNMKRIYLVLEKQLIKCLSCLTTCGIRATWATVGDANLFKDKKELMNNLPSNLPSYSNMEFSPYGKLGSIGENEVQDPFHYGQSCLKKFIEYQGQEISTHTFSHFIVWKKGKRRNNLKRT